MSVFKKALDNVGGAVTKAQTSTTVIGLEMQKKAKENTIGQAMQQIRQQRDNVYSKIGQNCFELYEAGEFSHEGFEDYFELLIKLRSNMEEQEALLCDIRKRHEEEVALLKGTANRTATAVCDKCGTEYSSGIDLFCKSCGNDLRKPATQAACPKCGTMYNSETAVFCKGCGFKLKED